MRLAYHFMGCLEVRDGQKWVRGQFGKIVEALANHVEHVDLLLDAKTKPNSSFEGQTDYAIQAQNIEWVSLGPYQSHFGFAKRTLTSTKNLIPRRHTWDFVLLREPSRRSSLIRRLTGSIPKVLWLGGDRTFGLAKHSDSSAFLYRRMLFFQQDLQRAAGSALVLVNNDQLYERWQPFSREIHLVRTTTINHENIVTELTPRFEHEPPYRLLFVGRLVPRKGLDYLLEALAILNGISRQQPLYVLTIVGDGDREYLRTLKEKSIALGISDLITWTGLLPHDRTLRMYQQADIFVHVPPEYEDLARTNWEAMSQGCPVITTPVGGQKTTFRDRNHVLFSKPGSSQDLVEKILFLKENVELRRNLQQQGLELVKSNTANARIREVLDIVSAYLQQNHRPRSS